ncbi:MAG: HAD-IA family hydrolase [Pseudomonadota bacterium]
MTLKLAIFDIDGTIVDSRKVIQGAMETAFAAAGLAKPDYDQTRRIVGLGLHDAMDVLAPHADADQREALVEGYKNAFIANRADPNFKEPLYEGAVDLLRDLSAQGWLMGVATGKSRRGLDVILDAHDLRKFFDTSWCADDGPGKPNPFMVQANMDALGVEAVQSVMIGDATFDMQMARAANVRALGVSWGFGEAHEIEAAGAHEVHHEFSTLAASLETFARERAA